MPTELKRLIDQVSREKGIDRETLVSTLEEAIRSAIKRRYGSKMDVEVAFNEEFGEFEAFLFKEVVEEFADEEREVLLEDARELDPDCEVGDELGVRMDTETLGRIAAQAAKQIIIQKVKDAEREAIYEEFKNRKGEIVNGLVQRVDKKGILVNLGRAEAILPQKEQIPKEVYRQGDRIRAYVLEVKKISKGPQIVLSRTHPHLLIQLFSTEVPEVAEGIVSIISAAREPGSRAKIAVVSKDPDVDPVGACVGMKGNRVQSVVHELRGEKIDIVPWHMDPAKFVVNSLAPAIISKVIIDQANRTMEVIVQDDQLSLAIGRRGQNVRLASKLTNWRIDVKNETRHERQKQRGYQALLLIGGLTEDLADTLYENGVASLAEFAEAGLADLQEMTGLSEATLTAMQEEAADRLRRGVPELAVAEEDDEVEAGIAEGGEAEEETEDEPAFRRLDAFENREADGPRREDAPGAAGDDVPSAAGE